MTTIVPELTFVNDNSPSIQENDRVHLIIGTYLSTLLLDVRSIYMVIRSFRASLDINSNPTELTSSNFGLKDSKMGAADYNS